MNGTIFRNILIVLSLTGLFLLAACDQTTSQQTQSPTPSPPSTNQATLEGSQEVKKFNSVAEIKEFLQAQQNQNSNNNYYGGAGMMIKSASRDSAMAESVQAPSAAPMTTNGGGADDYSQTNVQVKGVDEADFVKNDGKYIYMILQNKLIIADAFPAEDAEIVSETKIEGEAVELFVNGDRLVVFVHGQDQSFVLSQYDIIPYPRYTTRTHALIYDISDREDPELIKDYNLNGYYFDARMIGNHVYFIAKDDVYYYNGLIDTPMIREDKRIALQPEIYYFDNPEGNYVFHTIASFDVTNPDELEAKSYMMGYSNTMYVSENNIYITYQKNLPYYYYERHNEERFYEIIVPLLPSDVQSKISELKGNSDNSYEKWSKISEVLQEMYNSMDEQEKQELLKDMQEVIDEYEAKLDQERRKTIIHKIAIDEGSIEYETKGEVTGSPLNQFSMDEHDGNFRIATTTYVWTRTKSTMYNNVYVLDADLEVIGKVEDIAPEERIYSTRFIGDRLYMVTFKNIDPFFVIDLSNPSDPKILGELKIPGFSDYLHPYDENHIIGIGKETEGNEWGGVSTKGVKLALFDVSDVSNPKQLGKYEIGKQGTDSEALREHKAFLFDKNKNVLVIPIREVTGRMYDNKYGYYRDDVWQGAYVFGLTPEDGFELKGKISHGSEQVDPYYWDSPHSVRRALYMDDVLYTISMQSIKMNSLEDIKEEIGTIRLPYQKPDYGYYPGYPTPMPRPVESTAVGKAEAGVAVSTVEG